MQTDASQVSKPFRYAPLLLLAVALVSLGGLVFDGQPVGYRHDWNIPFFRDALQSMWHGTDGLTVWNAQQFGSVPFYPTLAPFLTLISALAYMGLPAGIIERIVMLGATFLSGYGMYTFMRTWGIDARSGLLAGVAYMTSPFLFTEMVKGILQDPVSYAAMPWAAWLLHRAVRERGLRSTSLALAAGLAWGITATQIQYLAFDGLVLLTVTVATRGYRSFLVCLVGLVLADAYIVLPGAASIQAVVHGVHEVSSAGFVHLWSPPLLSAVRLTGCDCTFPEQAAKVRHLTTEWVLGGYLVFACAVFGLIVQRSRMAKATIVLLAVGLLLATGTSVLGPAYLWLITHVPAGVAFRESYKFTAVVAFAISVGVGYASSAFEVLRGHAIRWAGPAAFSVVVSVALAGLPFLADGMETQVQRVAIPESALTNYMLLRHAQGGGRVAYLPMLVPMRPMGAEYPGIDPIISWPPRLSFGNYLSTHFSKIIASSFYHGSPEQLESLLRIGDIRYIEERHWLSDHFAESTDARNVAFDRDVLEGSGIPSNVLRIPHETLRSDGSETLLRVPFSEQSGFYPLSSLVVSTGDMADAAAILDEGRIVAFASQLSASSKPIDLLRDATALQIVNGEDFDLVAAIVPPRFVITPGRFTTDINANAGWANMQDWNTWWWYRNAYVDALEDVAIAGPDVQDSLWVPLPKASRSKLRVFAKIFYGPNNGELRFVAGNWTRDIVTIDERSRGGFRWVDLGTLDAASADGQMKIVNRSGENVVASVVAAPEGVVQSARDRVAELVEQKPTQGILTDFSREGALTVTRTSRYYVKALWRGFSASRGKDDVFVRIGGKLITLSRPPGRAEGTREITLGPGRHPYGVAGWSGPLVAVMLEPPLPSQSDHAYARLQSTDDRRLVGRANGPSVLEYDAGYSPGWTLGAGVPIHFVANGFANGWIVSHSGPVQVRYSLEGVAMLGRIISGISLLTIIAGVLLSPRRVVENI